MQKPDQISTKSGVYIFSVKGGSAFGGKNAQQKPIYIGKAGNLKKRLTSYWRHDAPPKTQQFVREAKSLSWQETKSEIEALILESNLIKQHRPKYNVLMRDDKNYFFVAITKEEFSRIFITHQPQNKKTEIRDQESVIGKQKLIPNRYPLISRHIGPFTSGAALKITLRLLRRIFPYCTCTKPHKRPCLNAEIGRCLGYCCVKMSKTKTANVQDFQRSLKILHIQYNRNIQNIIAVLQGKKQKLLAELKKQMREAARKQDYEKAARLRDQIVGLEDVFAHKRVLELPRAKSNWLALEQKLRLLFGAAGAIRRIEGYDISNISGTNATGSMVVFTCGKPDKKEYRTFRIKTVVGANDPAMIGEVIARRLNHKEWQYPDLIVIDGGKPQFNAALSHLTTYNLQLTTRLTALAKQEEELYTESSGVSIPLKTLDRDILHLFQAVRDEAHRFAKKYHHRLREKQIKK